MPNRCVASLDVGTTGIRCLLYDRSGKVIANAYARLVEIQERPGWSELDPHELFQQAKGVVSRALQEASRGASDIVSLGITTLRASFVTWSAKTNRTLQRIITWQDTRSKDICKRWNKSLVLKAVHGLGAALHVLTPDRSGRFQAMRIFAFDTLHVSGRLRWVLENNEEARASAAAGDLRFGTTDTWLLWCLTGGRVHATDYSNVSATGMYDFYVMQWSSFILARVGLPHSALPEIRDTSGDFGEVDAAIFGAAIPIRALVADQQSAMFGHGCFSAGDVKCSLGTGTFVNINTGPQVRTPREYSLYPMIAWKIGDELSYMCEGTAACTGTALEWAQDVGLLENISNVDAVVTSISSTEGVIFVNAFSGLTTPAFDPTARGSFMGLTSAARPAHMVRAVTEAIAFRFMDLFSVISREFHPVPRNIRVDGGVSRCDFIMQTISTLSGMRVQRSVDHEKTALGAAFLAGLGAGFWSSREELAMCVKFEKEFEPGPADMVKPYLALWRTAVKRSLRWPALEI